MEEDIKDKNAKDNINQEKDDRIAELDKNIYKEATYQQNSNLNEKIEINKKTEIKEIKETKEVKEEKKKELVKEDENNLNNLKYNDIINELDKIKKEKESLEKQNRLLEEKNNKLKEENTKLTLKLKNLKESLLKLKTCLEKDIYAKLESKNKLLKEILGQKNLLVKKNQSLNDEIKNLKLIEEDFSKYREKLSSLMKEKSKVDNITIKQEEKIRTYEEEINVLNKECKLKDEKYKKLDENYLGVIKIIEEHKKTILNLKNKIKIKESEDNNKKIIIFQKEQEIALLRNFINSYKNDIRVRFKNKLMNSNNDNYFMKREIPKLKTNRSDLELLTNKRFEQKFNKEINNNKSNLPKIDIQNNNKHSEGSINNNNILKEKLKNKMDEKDEESIKDISNMMIKMINND